MAARFNSSSTIPLWINGEQVTTHDSFDVVGPLDTKPVWRSSTATPADVDDIVASSQAAQASWSKTPRSERRIIINRASEIFARRADELQAYNRAETGMTAAMQALELGALSRMFANLAASSSNVAGYVPPVDADNETGMVLKVPWGVVLTIVPWNSPYGLGVRDVVPPLLMGNAVILKGSEQCPAAFWGLASVLHEAGVPAGCLNTVVHRAQDAPAVTAALVAHPAVRKLSFTGSSGTGAVIAALAGKHLTPCVLELGGKAPAVVCEDGDVADAAFKVARGAFLHGGQICMSTERVIVHRAVAGQFKQALAASIESAIGRDSQQLVSKDAAAKNVALVRDALAKGATVVYGSVGDGPAGSSMVPLVLEGASKDMDIFYNESFGPSVCLYLVDSDEQAIALANDTQYGLVASVFSRDLRRAMRIGKALDAGGIHINGMTVQFDNAMPLGGFKQSGFGRSMGREGMEEWVQTKTLMWNN